MGERFDSVGHLVTSSLGINGRFRYNKGVSRIIHGQYLVGGGIRASTLGKFFHLIGAVFIFSYNVGRVFTIGGRLRYVFSYLFGGATRFGGTIIGLYGLFVGVFSR